MEVTATELYDRTIQAWNAPEVQYIDSCGGTRSGKTFAVLQVLITLAYRERKKPTLASVVSETFPHLRRGAIKDFQRIMKSWDLWKPDSWKESTSTYTFDSGSQIEFFSADSPAKVHGPARDRLFINEAQNIPWETARQLFVRTAGKIFLDYNPTHEFWVHTQIRPSGKAKTIHSTYKDNPYLTPEQIAVIESNRTDESWWKVYGLGQTGSKQGLIYTNWEQVDVIPSGARFIARGLDFGFTHDPTAVVDVYLADGAMWLDERLYRPGLTNDRIAAFLKETPAAGQYNVLTIADSAEMKSIQEIRNFGVRRIEPAIKGQGSVNIGIDAVKRYPLKVTKRSQNLISELRNYMWRVDRMTGEEMNVPVDRFNHALDAVRYVVGNCLLEKKVLHKARSFNTTII